MKRAGPVRLPCSAMGTDSSPTSRVRFRLAGGLSARLGLVVLVVMLAACLGSLPWTLGSPDGNATPRYNAGEPAEARIAPFWAPGHSEGEPSFALGSDHLGRSVFVRALTGGGISLGIGLAAAFLSVGIGTLYGAVAGYAGGLADSVMMRVVDVLYGLPYILLVVLLAVASDALVDEYITRSKARTAWVVRNADSVVPGAPSDLARGRFEAWLSDNPSEKAVLDAAGLEAVPPRRVSAGTRTALDVGTLLLAIGGVSWLTMARVIRGQVLSLRSRPFVEAARAAGAGPGRIFVRHLLPNLVGPIVVYVTLTVPQAILQESFLSFLGIGVKPPLPSWGNLAADGLSEVNPYRSNWWLVVVPSVLLGVTLLSLNFVGEGLREAFDPRRAERGSDGGRP